MPAEIRELVEKIHASPIRIALVVSGGGSRAITHLLEVAGASATLLEAVVPYCEAAVVEYLGGPPDHFCSASTARSMAMAAFGRACRYSEGDPLPAGVACTASLATIRPKRGGHRVHVAVQTAARTLTWSLELQKGRRDRLAEEELAASVLINAVARACGLAEQLELELLPRETIDASATEAPQPWQDLLLGRREAVCHGTTPQHEEGSPRVVFPGAFHPMHDGHRGMARVASEMLGGPVEWELSIENVDKPPLDYTEIEHRLSQFAAEEPVWLTRAPTFLKKSGLFKGATFIVGADTLVRIAEPRYYGGDRGACKSALDQIARRGCRFLVFGRDTGSGFRNLSDLDLPPSLRSLCREVPAEQFRNDISSTELRRSQV